LNYRRSGDQEGLTGDKEFRRDLTGDKEFRSGLS
jgi:hypothetical protein